MSELRETPVHTSSAPNAGQTADLSLNLAQLKNSCDYWHFDGLSDDGREALLVRFYANYPFSSSYLKHIGDENGVLNLKDLNRIFPAVTFTYSVDGTTLLHAINEFDELKLPTPLSDGIRYTIGRSSFKVENAAYGSGYFVHLEVTAALNRRITAAFEWLSIESGPQEDRVDDDLPLGAWNLATPRADVSGRISMLDRHGDVRRQFHFRGTGYVDHIRGRRSGTGVEASRCWGRAHFADATAVYQHFSRKDGDQSRADLYVVQDGSVKKFAADCRVEEALRDRSGLRVPQQIWMTAEDGTELHVKPAGRVQSGLFEIQMLSEMTLKLPDGKERHTIGLTEFSDPGRLRNPVYRWLADLRTGKNGRSPLF
ncbi:MAG: hypothetical protein ABIV21_05435 [Pyrinomonadaceae bacterium]